VQEEHLKLLTIAIPVYENSDLIKQLIKLNFELFHSYPLMIINKSGGEELKALAYQFIQSDYSFAEARKLTYNLCKTKYILNLDSDTVLPKGYVEDALKLLESNPKIYVVGIDYEFPYTQGHMAFGASIGRVDMLKQVYRWNPTIKSCECIFIWTILKNHLVSLPYQAIHLKPKPL
jgi:hypothetical protein